MVDIQSTRMLGRVGFLAKVSFALTMWTIFGGIWFHSWYWFWISGRSHSDCDFCYLSETEKLCECHTRVTDMLVFQVFTTFEKLGISVDVLATSEVSISLTLDPSKLWSRELIQQVQLSPADLLWQKNSLYLFWWNLHCCWSFMNMAQQAWTLVFLEWFSPAALWFLHFWMRQLLCLDQDAGSVLRG